MPQPPSTVSPSLPTTRNQAQSNEVSGAVAQKWLPDASRLQSDPDTDIVTATRHIVDTNGLGTLLCLCLAYDVTHTAVGTPPVVRVFGRMDSDDEWMLLKNNGNAINTTFTPDIAATGDNDDGTLGYTTVDNDDHIFDLKGCREFVVGVVTAIAATTGSIALAKLQAKMF